MPAVTDLSDRFMIAMDGVTGRFEFMAVVFFLLVGMNESMTQIKLIIWIFARNFFDIQKKNI